MSGAPTPTEVFDRAVAEGERRLDQSLLELVSTSFIAGFTVVFGIVALGIVQAAVEPSFGDAARVAGALAFAPGLVFLVVGRTELFNENFLDPAATAVDRDDSWLLGSLVRLWSVTFVLNLAGGVLIAIVFATDGTLPTGTPAALASVAEEIVHRPPVAKFAAAIAGGALVAVLSYLLVAVDTVGNRITVSFAVGFFLALGPFDHVVVTTLHAVLGVFFGADVGYGALGATVAIATAGNFVGGLGLVTLTHVTQVIGAE